MTGTIPEKEHVFVRGEGGSVFKLDLPLHETITERLSKGYLTRVANADGDPYVEGAEASTVAALPTERPALNAGKPAWVGWAVVKGMTPDDSEALTKKDLIERFGAESKQPEQPEQPDDQGTEPDKADDPASGDDEHESEESEDSDGDGSEDATE
ncbi:MAG: hypothetical protein ACRDT9_06175 [Agromyces sp.]